jgi:glycosyltransferase involved in cell wall biosynthesis
MRILVLTTSYPCAPGDYRGRFVHDVARSLAGLGHAVRVLTPHPGRNAARVETLDGVTVERVGYLPRPLSRRPSLFGSFGIQPTLAAEKWRWLELPPALAALAARAWGQCRSADLVVSNWLLPCGLIAGLARGQGGPRHLAIEHGGGLRLLAGLPLGRHVFALAADRADLLHFVSSSMKEKALGFLPKGEAGQVEKRTIVFPMPPAQTGNGRPGRHYFAPLKMLFVGRLVPEKGLLTLLAGLALTRQSVLTVVGDGPERARAEELVQSHRLAGRVVFKGERAVQALPGLMAEHDALLIPSAPATGRSPEADLTEGTPRVLLEGMAMGLVPVVSPIGGLGEIVRPGENGLTCAGGDAADLARQIRSLANNPKLCGRLSKAATATAQRYSMERMLKLWQARIPGL